MYIINFKYNADMNWEIEYYATPSGQEVVKDFIDGLQETDQAKLGHNLELLEQYGYNLGMPHARPLGRSLMELRVRSGRGRQEIRVFYVFVKNRRIYLLHGFIKTTQTTPKKELDIARSRQAEVDRP